MTESRITKRRFPPTFCPAVIGHASADRESELFFHAGPSGFFIHGTGPARKKTKRSQLCIKPIYFNDLPGIVRCVPFVHQADRRARTVGTATFAKGPAPSRGRGREPDGDEIVANGFAIRENDLPKTDTKRSQFSYRASFFNHLEEISEAKNRRRSGAKPAPRLFVHRIGGPRQIRPGPAAAKPI